jgi:D-amino-acid dehydrogenase
MFDATSPLYIRPRLSRELISWLWSFHRHCTQRHLDRCMPVLCDMGFKSLAIVETMIEAEGIRTDYARDGWLDVVTSADALDHAEHEARSMERFGYIHRRVDRDELRRREPIFNERVAGAIHWLDSAHVYPDDLLQGLASACQRRGAEMRVDADVVALERSRDGHVGAARLRDDSIVEGDAVVLAAGVWSTELARSVGVRMPMVGARGYHVQLSNVASMPSTGMVLRDSFVAVTPMRTSEGHEELRLAGTLEIDRLDQPWRRPRLDALKVNAMRTLNGLEHATTISEWAGYRPCTSDGMPIVGFARDAPGLMIVGGHAMMGMTLGPVTGQAATEILFGEKTCFDAGMLRADRF